MKPIRPLYDSEGVEGYYRAHAHEYQNPHLPVIRRLLERNLHRLDLSKPLDFAAGGGEITLILQANGIVSPHGCDPFTYDLYERQTGLHCRRLSFLDVVQNGLGESYSVIICSFALHLCPLGLLYPLVWRLFEAAPQLVVFSPHKRPELELLPSVHLLWEDSDTDEREKRVRLKTWAFM